MLNVQGESAFQSGVTDIAMDKIVLGNSQARQRDTKVSKDDDLVTSIKKHGLLSPILVREIDGGRYELVAGQRRYYAHEELGKQTIKSLILAPGTSEVDAKKISFTENLVRKDMKHADYVDTVEWLMERYGKVATVAEELGVSQYKIKKYMSISRLPDEVRGDISNNEYAADHAKKALDALGGEASEVDVQVLRETAKAIRELQPQARTKFVKIKQSQPDTSIDDAAKKAKERTNLHKFYVEVTDDRFDRIDNFKNSRSIPKIEEAAEELIDIGLEAVEE